MAYSPCLSFATGPRAEAGGGFVKLNLGAGDVASGAVPDHARGHTVQGVERLDKRRHFRHHLGTALFGGRQIVFDGAGQAKNALFTHLHGAANPRRLALHPLNVLGLADHQPAGGAFDRLRTAVDHRVRAGAVVRVQIFFRRGIDDERQVVFTCDNRRLLDAEHAFLHAVVRFDVHDRRRARVIAAAS